MFSLAGVDVMSNAVESLNYGLRRIVKDKDAFRNGEALMKWVIAGKNNIPYYPCLSGMVYTFRFFQ